VVSWRAPMNFVNGRLVGTLDDHLVDANMRRTTRRPKQGFGDVFGGKRVDSFVNLPGPLRITLETDQGKFGFRQAGINRADAHAGAGKLQPERLGNSEFSGLGAAVGCASFVSDVTGDRADVQNGAAWIVHHERQAGASHAQQAEHVRLHHEFQVFVPGLGHVIEALRSAGVVDEHVEPVAVRACPSNEVIDTFGLGNIERSEVNGRRPGSGRFRSDGLEPVQAPRAEEQFRAFPREGARRRGAEAAGRAGDQDPFIGQRRCHGGFLSKKRTESKGRVGDGAR
jgi:hypothetical protein